MDISPATFAPEALSAIHVARSLAEETQTLVIGTNHILGGLSAGSGAIAALLNRRGVTLSSVRRFIESSDDKGCPPGGFSSPASNALREGIHRHRKGGLVTESELLKNILEVHSMFRAHMLSTVGTTRQELLADLQQMG